MDDRGSDRTRQIPVKIGNPLTGFIPFNDNFIFVGSDKRYYQTGIDAYKIFITDRYNHRTIVLRELDNTDDIGIFDYVVVKNKFYFWNGGLWQTNGKSNGTSLIKGIKSDLNLKGATLFAIGDKVYFRTFDSQGDPRGLFTQKSEWIRSGSRRVPSRPPSRSPVFTASPNHHWPVIQLISKCQSGGIALFHGQ